MTKPPEYRTFVDAIVDVCKTGQGQVGALIATRGTWNPNHERTLSPEQQAANALLAKLSQHERESLAHLLRSEFEAGVFETLKLLQKTGVAPFESGYEGGPPEDFIGRMNGWTWPAAHE